MKHHGLAFASLVTATLAFASGCDTKGLDLGAIGGKLKGVRDLAQQALQSPTPAMPNQGFLPPMNEGLAPTPGGGGMQNIDIGSMNADFDQRFDQMAQQMSWQLARQIPNDVPMNDLAAQLRANSAQAESGLAYIRRQEVNSDRQLDAVEDWDHQVLRDEVPIYVPNDR